MFVLLTWYLTSFKLLIGLFNAFVIFLLANYCPSQDPSPSGLGGDTLLSRRLDSRAFAPSPAAF